MYIIYNVLHFIVQILELEKIIYFYVQYYSLYSSLGTGDKSTDCHCHNPASLPANFKQMIVLVSHPTPPPQSSDHIFPNLESY